MKFNSGTDSILDEINALCDSDDTSYPVADKTRRVNIALDEIIALILSADGTWQYDDTNQTDLPIGTANLVDSQQDYTFPDEFLQIDRVEVKDANGNWHKIQPFDHSDYPNQSVQELYSSNGMPQYYEKVGRSVLLYPTPSSSSVTTTAGLKVWFKRNSTKFTTSDTTKEPGFASVFHSVLAYMASIPYCMTYKQDRVDMYKREVGSNDPRSPYFGGIQRKIAEFYSRREKDVPQRLKANVESNK